MVNSTHFTSRLKKILEHYQLTAAHFAEEIGVQRSSISHLLSGRNKPSLDFVLKIIESYPEVDMYWLLNGKGDFPKKSTPLAYNAQDEHAISTLQMDGTQKKITKIVVFYQDGTFDEYHKG